MIFFDQRSSQLLFVDQFLGNFTLTMLAPLPSRVADNLIEMLLGGVNGAEPDGVGVGSGTIELRATSKVKQVRSCPNRTSLTLGWRNRSMENVTDGPKPHLGQILGVLDRAD